MFMRRAVAFVHVLTARRSRSASVVVLAFATKQDRELMSKPMLNLLNVRASTIVVAPPMKGSSTKSPGDVKARIAARAKRGEKRAGYL
jgi:hypothetical protein